MSRSDWAWPASGPAARFRLGLIAVWLAVLAPGTLGATGCADEASPPTVAGRFGGRGLEGAVRLAVAAPLEPIAERHADHFERLYPAASVTLQPTTAREALVALQRRTADAALIDREPTDAERDALRASGLTLTEALVGAGAVVFVTAGERTSLPLADLDEGRVRLVVASRNTGVAGVLEDRLGDRFRPEALLSTDAEVLRYVAARSRLVGAVSMAATDTLPAGLRVLSLVADDGTAARPRPRAVFEGSYEVVQPLVLVTVREESDAQATTALRAGFARFAVGTQGQEAVVRAGFAPATLPEREVVIGHAPAEQARP